MTENAPLHARLAHRARRKLAPHVRLLLQDAGFPPPALAPERPVANGSGQTPVPAPAPVGVVPPPGGQVIVLEYATDPTPRWGYGKPPHPLLAERIGAGNDRYAETLRGFLPHADVLAGIPIHPTGDPYRPSWLNGAFPGLDVVALYGFLASERPRRYVEIGSGQSTRVARFAIESLGLPTTITSIDPHPAVETDAICDIVHRTQLEKLDLGVLTDLEPGDVLFVDGTHRTLMNSDVTVALLEVLPALPPGVLVQVHDIRLPWDYPPAWGERYYSEQYILAAYLLAKEAPFRVELPNWHVTSTPGLVEIMQPLWSRLDGAETHGESFWIRTT